MKPVNNKMFQTKVVWLEGDTRWYHWFHLK